MSVNGTAEAPGLNDQTKLSPRELELLNLVIEGRSNKEIAGLLSISTNTVKVHLSNIFQKLGVSSRTEATHVAIQRGMVSVGTPINKADTGETPISLNGQVRPSRLRLLVVSVMTLILVASIVLVWTRSTQQRNNSSGPPLIAPIVNSNWIELPKSPIHRTDMAITTFGNLIYLIGGTAEGRASVATEVFDPTNQTYRSLADKPTAVLNTQAAQINGQIIIPGGKSDQGIATDVVEIFNISENSWTTASPLPKPLHSYAIAAYQGKLFVFGGYDDQNISSEIYTYRLDIDQWQEAGSLMEPVMEASAVISADQIFIIGGLTEERITNTVQIFNPATPDRLAWKEGSELPFPGTNLSVSEYGGLAFVLYTRSGESQNPSLIYLDTSKDEWVGKVDKYTLPPTRSASTILYGLYYVFGFSPEKGSPPRALSYRVVYNVMLPITTNN